MIEGLLIAYAIAGIALAIHLTSEDARLGTKGKMLVLCAAIYLTVGPIIVIWCGCKETIKRVRQ